MTKRKKLWYGFLVLIMIASSSYAIYAEICRKDWLWATAGSIGVVGVVVTYGMAAIGAARNR